MIGSDTVDLTTRKLVGKNKLRCEPVINVEVT